MKRLSSDSFRRARAFVLDHARPLERALFAHEFEGGSAEAVWHALQVFANADGGFGHALEPDCRAPDSSTLATITAFPLLRRTGAPADHPLVVGGVRYLVDSCERAWPGWRALPPSANDHPRAFWWNHDPAAPRTDEQWSNPSAAVVACLHHYPAEVPPDLLQAVTEKAFAVLDAQADTLSGHDFLTFVELAESLPAPLNTRVWSRLKTRARTAILTDPAQWTGYGVRPLWAVTHPQSPLMDGLDDAVLAHLDYEIDQQQPDGSWHPFWSWGRFETDWATARREWQGQLTVKTLTALKAFGRLDA